MEEIPCPDGYLLDPKSPFAVGHHALNEYLVRVEEAGWQKALKEVNAIRDKARKLLIWKALIERLHWLADHNPNSSCLSPLRGLAERIEKWRLSPTEAELIEILDRTGEAAGLVTPYTPMPHLMAHVEKNGLTAELATAIRRFRERFWDQSYTVNQVSLQLFRSRMDMLAWRDEWTAIDPGRCWSEQVRAEFRAMAGIERENWRRLLYSINGDEGPRPAPRWLADARVIVEAIGVERFRASLMRWFEPLQRGRKQRLSREGSFLLRAFVWLAQPLQDTELLARVEEMIEVDFKPKSNGQKVIRAAAEATGKPDPAAQSWAAPPSLDSLVARALSAAFSPAGSLLSAELAGRVQVGAESVYVRGDLDSYEVHISTGAIFRASDGKRVHVRSTDAWIPATGLPNLGGIAVLVGHILILAQDAKHAAELIMTAE